MLGPRITIYSKELGSKKVFHKKVNEEMDSPVWNWSNSLLLISYSIQLRCCWSPYNSIVIWKSTNLHRWYDQHVGIGATTSTNEKCWHDLTAFCWVSERNFKITHSNDPQSHSQGTAWPDKHSDLKSQVMGTVELVQSLKALWTNIHGLHSNKTPGERRAALLWKRKKCASKICFCLPGIHESEKMK